MLMTEMNIKQASDDYVVKTTLNMTNDAVDELEDNANDDDDDRARD